jgi:TolB-like protein/class 3 adenylate cyclase/Flp pilus assembly protein TadD
MASTRRLTAILAADVAGYSRLMAADEEGTHERLRAHLAQLVDPKIRAHKGRTVKTTGDGLLAEFASVVDAVRCAAEVQRGMIDRERMVAEEWRIRFRIGVNLGDVIAEDDDIFGDGVNVAARLEALAEPGGICISRTVRDQIRDKLPYPLDDLGEQSVKNIARPVRVYALRREAVADLPASVVPIAAPRRRHSVIAALAAAALAALVIAAIGWWVWPAPKSPATSGAAAAMSLTQPFVAPPLSIVVLPFANLSGNPKQQYFADGITEDLTTDLSRIADMLVISRDSAFTYKDKPVNAKQIGRELGVRYVLGGSVQRSGDEVRINAQLINAETDTHLWAERFDRDMGDLFALQDEVTRQIARALDIELVAAEAARPNEHPDALDYILRGRAAMYKPATPDSAAAAISLFERALALDPQSVEAQSLLTVTLVGRVLNGMSDTAKADIKRAEELATEAVAASPQNPLAHLAKAIVLRVQRRCAEAIPEYETVLALNRNSASALADIGRCRIFAGPIEEAIPLEEQAIRLSPRDPRIAFWYYRIGEAYLLQSRNDEAIEWLEKARNANAGLWFVQAYLASAYALKGETERATAELAEARRLRGGGEPWSVAVFRADTRYETPTIRGLSEVTFYAGLRKAGMPEK